MLRELQYRKEPGYSVLWKALSREKLMCRAVRAYSWLAHVQEMVMID